MPINGYIDPGAVVHPHLYLPLPTRSPLYKVTAATPPHTLMSSVNMTQFINSEKKGIVIF